MWHDQIDQIIYINLDYRTDRNRELLDELKKIDFPMTKVTRFEAKKNRISPVAGCSFSHAKVLELAYELNYRHVLILEDDCYFINVDQLNETMNHFFNHVKNWDGMLLIKGNGVIEPYDDKLNVCLNSSNAVAYLVSRQIMMPLSETIYNGGINLLTTNAHWLYANDVVWNEFMKDKTWYSPNESLCYQRPSFSDLSNTMVDHR